MVRLKDQKIDNHLMFLYVILVQCLIEFKRKNELERVNENSNQNGSFNVVERQRSQRYLPIGSSPALFQDVVVHETRHNLSVFWLCLDKSVLDFRIRIIKLKWIRFHLYMILSK